MALACKSPSRAGMTLVEITIAGAIGLGMMLLLYSSMSGSARRFQSGEAGIEGNLEVQQMLKALRQDIEGPKVWGPCDTPPDVLLRIGHSKADIERFGVARRTVFHTYEYYLNDAGPRREPTKHEASPVRKLGAAPPGGCGLIWDGDRAQWRTAAPSGKDMEDRAAMVHSVEAVYTASEVSPRYKPTWIIGPSFWIYDKEAGLVHRFHKVEGWSQFGMSRLLSFDLLPDLEQAHEVKIIKGKTYTYTSVRKVNLNITMSLGRKEREPIVLSTSLRRKGR